MSILDFLNIFDLDTNTFLDDLRDETEGSPTLPNGIASGDTGQTSTILWTRSTETDFVAIEYATTPDFSEILGTLSTEVSDPNQPVKLELSGLQPNTEYYYRVTDGEGSSQIGRFKTAAEVGTVEGLRFGVSGDWRGELSPYPAITNADEKDLDFFVLHGDTVYADFPSPALNKPQAETLDEFRLKHAEVYGERAGLNTWGELRASTSVFATIDDHEVTNDFSGGAPAFTDPLGRFGMGSELINDTPLYDNGLQAFQEYNPIRDEFYGETGDSRTEGERKLYRTQTYGSDAAVFILDSRSFRDPALPQADLNDTLEILEFLGASFDPSRTMLGRVQVEDLKQDLLAAENAGVTWKFVMVPEPIQNLGLIAAGDRFEGYAAERTEILNFIDTNDIDNVVFVAADIHGTVVNNLTYQLEPLGQQIPTNTFEISTGSVAFDAPFGPTVIDLAADVGLLSPEQVTFFNSLPREGQDAFIEELTNAQLQSLGYDPIGLQGSPINAQLLQGGYVATQTFGWTEFEIDPNTQELLVTTYGIDPYTEAELNTNPETILDRSPEVVSQFSVTPEFDTARFASFNASLNRNTEGQLIADLSTPENAQAQTIAEIIQRNSPDVVLVNEFDFDANGQAAQLFQDNYLSVSQNGASPINYPYRYVAPSNTGIASGFDFDNNGSIVTTPGENGYGNDAFGFGNFPGQFGMVLYSKYPIETDEIRTFQNFLWKDMPGALLPDDPDTPEPNDWYSEEELEAFRLSSKSHWDIPVNINGQTIHVLASHPTPPVFDGPEDRNGRRNHDEIRFWADYVTPDRGDYIYDDAGNTGGLTSGDRFVIVGDQNADPFDGDSTNNAISQLLDNPTVNTRVTPASIGSIDATNRQGSNNLTQTGNPAYDTADFGEAEFNGPGNVRVDYVLPSENLEITDAGVFWPTADDPQFGLVGDFPFPSSDHRLVYADVVVAPPSVDVPTVSSIDRLTVSNIDLLGEVNFPTGLEFGGTEVGGLSGITYDAERGLYYSLSDDRSQTNPARYYTLNIDLSDGSLDNNDVNFIGVTTLLDRNGEPFPENSLDPEGLALTSYGTLIVSSEGDANNLVNPFVREYRIDGQQLGEFSVPAKYLPTADNSNGIRNNLAFESLTLTPDGSRLYTATENALNQDGPAATVETSSLSRILEYDLATGQPAREFVYEVEEVPDEPIPADAFSTNGLVELLALDNNGTFLALERAFSVGVGNTVKLYEVNSQGALDVSGENDLFWEEEGIPFEIDPPVQKRLLLDFAEIGVTPDNLEGLALGPVLPDGRQSLIVVSDNNFNETQSTQFVALALELDSIPAAVPTLETVGFVDDEDAPFAGDSDDPAIWVNSDNPDNSLVIATAKDGGLVTFDLNGNLLQRILPAGFGEIRYNNVDIVSDFDLGERTVDLAIASDRENDTLAIWRIDENSRELVDVTSPNILETIFGVDDGEQTAYGLTAYTEAETGIPYVFVSQGDGNLLAQLELVANDEGQVSANLVRTLSLPVPTGDPEDSQSEGLVVDVDRNVLYVALEEEVGLLKTDASPNGNGEFTLVQAIDSGDETRSFDEIVVFGDSLSDVGNAFIASSGANPPSPPYFEGRFSNGELVVERLAQSLDLEASLPVLAGGNNFAVGGATTGFGTSIQGAPNIGEQINLYLNQDSPDASDLVYLYAGSNNFVQSSTPVDPATVVNDIVGHITTLAEAGAQTFIVPNLGDFGQSPFVRSIGRSEEISTSIENFNVLLDTSLDVLESDLGVDIIELDFAGVIDAIQDNPSAFGLSNIQEAAFDITTGTVVENPDEYLFWDDFHPSAAIQEIVAQAVRGELEGLVSPEFSPLKADIEGLSIYDAGDGEGYILVSSQGDSTYAVFDREGDNPYLGSFVVADNATIDQANESDGLDVVSANLGDKYPDGLLVVQDGANDPQAVFEDDEELENRSTNFKFVSWDGVAQALGLSSGDGLTGDDDESSESNGDDEDGSFDRSSRSRNPIAEDWEIVATFDAPTVAGSTSILEAESSTLAVDGLAVAPDNREANLWGNPFGNDSI
ncbi:MAG: phytase [Cyanobacteria bacterium SID2]|nr:phytase [Cyanobacteria bacterium SID2]